jgi:NAD(P)-dependent dehydrogenase (short-subunit alcohol dehydrogenase family)
VASLEGKRLLVVGASSGIGRATARAAVGAGAVVVFAARRRERLDDAVAEAGGGSALTCDIRDEGACAKLVAASVEVLGGLDALLFAAAASPLARLADVASEDWRDVLETNVIGAASLTRAALPHLTGHGVAWYFSSDTVGRPREGLVPYSASKAALDELIRGLRAERDDVRFTRIQVGPTIGTEFATRFDPGLAAELFPKWAAQGFMTAELMQPDEVGSAVVAALSLVLRHEGLTLPDLCLQPRGGIATSAS